ncbi:MAG: hypothetical protein GX573_24785 [Chloroflexi bacterium]|nr:hypothetical protein [Chloroflexota bacterium]
MPHADAESDNLDLHAILDGLDQGILVFDPDDRLVLDNVAARMILGARLVTIRSDGWRAMAALLDAGQNDRPPAGELRSQAMRQIDPVRLRATLSGTSLPCVITPVYGASGALYTMITLERPDWSELAELMGHFREEALGAISSTRGHADLIRQILARRTGATTPEELARRIDGFADIMAIHMARLERLIALLYRLELVRTGQLAGSIRANRRPIALGEFVEDLLEDIAGEPPLDQKPPDVDLRDRIWTAIPEDIAVLGSPAHLETILRDLLRNSLMYSPPDAPITIRAAPSEKGRAVEIEVIDEGCGIREAEAWRVFAPFERARQPQIIAEFGYGLSLYLAKAEIEAMGGRIGFESQEGIGTAFSLQLPAGKST